MVGEFTALVHLRRVVAPEVVELVLRLRSEQPLPEWQPGAHIDLILPSGLVRQYSLCGDPGDRTAYTIAVLRETAGRGGSLEVHDTLLELTEVQLRGPRNHFQLVDADSYTFIAGGIGVTPLLAMARQVSAAGIPWRFVYGGRTAASMAYVSELQALPHGQLELVPQDCAGLLDVRGILAGVSPHTAVFTCGPEPMLQAIESAAKELLQPGQLHLERFAAKADTDSALRVNTEFEVELSRSGTVLTVPEEQRLIDVVRTVAPQVPFSCEEGYCGSCETSVLAGVPDHRDQILSEIERAANDTMMICVGRALSSRLVLDL